MSEMRKFKCGSCGYEWEEPYGTGRPAKCPKCGSTAIYRIDGERGFGRGGRGFGGRGRGFGRRWSQ